MSSKFDNPTHYSLPSPLPSTQSKSQ